jgi:bis(5'-nucleosidyl)-tetraphosphatase
MTPPPSEHSAGVLVFHDSDESPPTRTHLVLDYGRHWDLAKGHLEPGESDLQAALRELAEETGLTSVELIPGFVRRIEYVFRRRQTPVHKFVTYFLARTTSTRVRLSEEHVGYAFLNLESAQRRLTYPAARQLLRDAESHLSRESSQTSLNTPQPPATIAPESKHE